MPLVARRHPTLPACPTRNIVHVHISISRPHLFFHCPALRVSLANQGPDENGALRPILPKPHQLASSYSRLTLFGGRMASYAFGLWRLAWNTTIAVGFLPSLDTR